MLLIIHLSSVMNLELFFANEINCSKKNVKLFLICTNDKCTVHFMEMSERNTFPIFLLFILLFDRCLLCTLEIYK